MNKATQESSNEQENVLKDSSTVYRSIESEIDLSLLMDSLAKTPWERMQANDDALNFSESLQMAMKKRHAKSQ